MSSLRIMVVGHYMWPWYQEVCANALEGLGCIVERFGWIDDFHYWHETRSEPQYHSFWHRLQARFHTGPTVWKVQRRLLQQLKYFNPDIVWFYNVQLISPSTVRAMRKILPKAILVQYANDNPFSPLAKRTLWRNFIASIPLFDVHLAFRNENLKDLRDHGAKVVHLLRAYFIPEVEYYVPRETVPDRFLCDVVFAGHYEDDGRVEILEAICDAGFKLNLFGGGWDKALTKLRANSPLRVKYPIFPVTGNDYLYAVCGAKVALCFLSTLNRDTYTRRSFQIPAMKTAMLSQYTDDLASLYDEDKEIVFFRGREEVIKKLERLISDDVWRQSVAEGGYLRVFKSGHDVKSRMVDFLKKVSDFKNLGS